MNFNKTQPKARKQYHRISSVDFVKVWMSSGSLEEVAQRMELDNTQASAKATTLRRRGVRLPLMKEIADPESTAELNKLVARMTKK